MSCTRMNKDVQRLTRFRIVNYKRALCGLIFLTFVHTEFFRPSSNIWIRLFQIELDHLRSLDLMIVRMTRSFKLNRTIFVNLTVRLIWRILGSYDSKILIPRWNVLEIVDRTSHSRGLKIVKFSNQILWLFLKRSYALFLKRSYIFWTCQKL